ncbi:hypothetical protein [Bradyrhizobium sp. USDA 4545]|uniref:hypothetical protein n=1 Tax=Bradyrhizobium sp. USDA 4545 TaxID=2817705 RepID=UPI0020A55D1C|nr:hypothetical protein [Bradyrhizobium sp. USDA 4545]MCP1832805.1 hypothetical protein [Bradyrhizobium sp. USDA 4545]
MTRAQDSQFDLFGEPAAPPTPAPASAVASAAVGHMHWLAIGTRRAKTACGILVETYDRNLRRGFLDEGREFVRCTHDYFDGSIDCAACLEVIH